MNKDISEGNTKEKTACILKITKGAGEKINN